MHTTAAALTVRATCEADMRRRWVLRVCGLAAAALAALALSPWSLAPGRTQPTLAGAPWSFWIGIAISSAITVIVAIAAVAVGGDDSA